MKEDGVKRKVSLPPALLGLVGVWAFAESGLGGMMHALKLPFTGIWVGGTAVAVLIVMAAVARGRYGHKPQPFRARVRTLLQATTLVIAVKLAASPHSPPTAYLAVGFQGLLAAGLLTWLKPFRLAAVLFAVGAMLESALQKLLVMTMIYGSAWFDALEAMMELAARQLAWSGLNGSSVLAIYLAMYTAWGLILGFWASGWSHRNREVYRELAQTWNAQNRSATPKSLRRPRRFKGLFLLSGLAVILISLAWSGVDSDELLAIGIRSFTATAILLFAAGPLRRRLSRWLSRSNDSAAVGNLVEDLDVQRSKFKFCWQQARGATSSFQRPFRAVEYFIHIDLHD